MSKLGKKLLISLYTMAFLSCIALNVNAAVVNPFPGTTADDDGTSYFSLLSDQISFQEFSDGVGDSVFGFFFQGTDPTDPANLIPIFEQTDQAAPDQIAIVDFAVGKVFDVDEGNIEQNSFAAGGGNIGFYLWSASANFIAYTDDAYNTAGLDLAGTFPLLTDPAFYVLGFVEPQGLTTVALETADGITPVPVPATIFLFCSGLAGLFLRRRK